MALVEVLGEGLLQSSRFQEIMQTQKFCIYNLSRERLVRFEVEMCDTTAGTLKNLVDALFHHAEDGLWLQPYRGIPSVPGLRPFDLICLDDSHQVIEQVESLSTVELVPLEGVAASALVLPTGSIRSSETEPGDRFEICPAEEMESRLARGAIQATAQPVSTGVDQGLSELFPRNSPFAPERLSWKTRLQRWIVPDRRRAARYSDPELVAFSWSGSTPRACRVGNISNTGMYLVTQERWLPGTMIAMTLQKANSNGDSREDAIGIQTRVVRWGNDGEGLDFILPGYADADPSSGLTGEKALKKFLRQL